MAAVVYDVKTKKPIETPHEDLEVLDQLKKRETEKTPDFLKLKLDPHHPVFLYGNFKAGGPYHQLVEDAPYLGEATTATMAYTMEYWKGSIKQPIVRRSTPSSMLSAKIWGEVYVLTPEQILELDELLDNTVAFRREQSFVYLRNQTYITSTGPKRPSIKAWTYFGTSFWNSADTKICNKFHDKDTVFYEWDAWLNQDFGTTYGNSYGAN